LIDEVLAVGDAEFQKKCLGKMDEVSKSGRTVIFVSHNLGAVRQLCSRGILLKKGKILLNSDIDITINKYLESNTTNQKYYSEKSIVQYLSVKQEKNTIILSAKYQSKEQLFIPSLGFIIYNNLGIPVTGFNPTLMPNHNLNSNYANDGLVKVTIKQPLLLDGQYTFSIWFGNGYEDFFEDKDCLQLDIKGMTHNKQMPTSIVGFVSPECNYQFTEI
jgi:lipopolysaccharide transport system ATP-binding protein